MTINGADHEMTFEQAFTRLEDVVRQLEGGTASLDRAISLYEEGMKLSKLCDGMLQGAQLRVTRLQEELTAPNSSHGQPTSGDAGRQAKGPQGGTYANGGSGSFDEAENLPW